ncbi:chaperone modulator CbpM [Winogradskyella rapida]|uniref:Chaperone modulator CbpM n=1 Tax=Winogradskyella rapida TaxID=549701 RepID=A0ABW3KRS2_9FLAO
MDSTKLISIRQFCIYYDVPLKFITALNEYGLIEFTITEEEHYLHTNQLHTIEKMMRLHYDLDINLEGIDAIHNLLKQVEQLQDEVRTLKNKLEAHQNS